MYELSPTGLPNVDWAEVTSVCVRVSVTSEHRADLVPLQSLFGGFIVATTPKAGGKAYQAFI